MVPVDQAPPPPGDDEAQRARVRAALFGGGAAPSATVPRSGTQPGAADLARAMLAAVDDAELDGQLIGGRYRVRRPLGRGGMGQVYLALDQDTGREVALKVLGLRHANDRRIEERFMREARASSRIRHPNVVEIYDFGRTPDGRPYFTMEYLPGEDLTTLLEREGPLHWPRARGLVLQILAALQAAHERGIIHRDVKPANCRVLRAADGSERLKVLDFGIAKAPKQLADEHSLTKTGAIMGTVGYMAPEQAKGRVLDPRADLYAVGVIAFEMLTGRQPFSGGSPMVVVSRQATQEAPRLRAVNPQLTLPEGLEDLVHRTLARDREQRPETAAHLAVAIRAMDPDGRASMGPAPATDVEAADPARRRMSMLITAFLLLMLIAALSLG